MRPKEIIPRARSLPRGLPRGMVLLVLLWTSRGYASLPPFLGTYLEAHFNLAGTLSDGDRALELDPDGVDYLPQIEVLLPDRAGDRFALSYIAEGEPFFWLLEAPPAEIPVAPTYLYTVEGDTQNLKTTYSFPYLELAQTARLRAAERVLSLEVTLTNRSSVTLTSLSYLRAVNPDPELTHEGSSLTLDSVYEGSIGRLALAEGPISGRSVGLGLLEGTLPLSDFSVGFCYRCVDPSTVVEDQEGRLEDWDVAVQGAWGSLKPGASLTFSLVYLAHTSPEALITEFEGLVDADLDGYTVLMGDCEDQNASRHPGATETCDNVDQDCDGTKDEDTACFDDDQDGYTERGGDCDDTNAAIRPLAPEGADTDGDLRPEGDGLDNDCDGEIDEGTDDEDVDGDGFSLQEGDCRDQDPSISPGANDTPYDGIDQDCDGADLIDVDGDGFTASVVGGSDCRDGAETIYPGAQETLNLLDDDCDGLTDEFLLHEGLVLLNEVMADPLATADREGEYLELLNTGMETLVLDGWELSNAAGQRLTFPSTGNLRLEPQGVLLLAASLEYGVNGGLEADGLLEVTLANESETLTLRADGIEVDALSLGEAAGLPIPEGRALQRDPSCLLPGALECFCQAEQSSAPNADRGSPGQLNPPCPRDDDLDGYASLETGGSDCNDSAPTIHPNASEDGGTGDGHANGVDDDCDGVTDNGTLEVDDDGDGYSEQTGDCDDSNAAISPSSLEVIDGRDNDCDGEVDFPDEDLDQDGYTVGEGDCDDTDPSSYPGAGTCLEPTPTPSPEDRDGDGYAEDDCDDNYAAIHPGALEVCGDGVDQNCSGISDEGCVDEGCGGCAFRGGASTRQGRTSDRPDLGSALMLLFLLYRGFPRGSYPRRRLQKGTAASTSPS